VNVNSSGLQSLTPPAAHAPAPALSNLLDILNRMVSCRTSKAEQLSSRTLENPTISNGESQFVGSSSGVFFINTVRRAFSTAAATVATRGSTNDSPRRTSLNEPSLEDCIDGTEAYTYGSNEPSEDSALSEMDYYSSCCKRSVDSMSKLPNYDVARQLVMTYFRMWHPLLPFLHGPSCLLILSSVLPSSQNVELYLRQCFRANSIDNCVLPMPPSPWRIKILRFSVHLRGRRTSSSCPISHGRSMNLSIQEGPSD
jgi:hypothetical protein